MSTKNIIMFSMATMLPACFVSSAVIVDFDSANYLAATTDFARKSGTNNIPFSADVALSPGAASGDSSKFYGGVELRDGGVLAEGLLTNTRIENGAAGNTNNLDSLHLRADTNPALAFSYKLSSLILWDKADFLADGSSDIVSFDVNSGFTLRAHAAFDAINRQRALVISEGGSYYRSNFTAFAEGPSTAAQTVSFSSLSWFEYDPTAAIDTDISGATAATPDFSDIDAVGIYLAATGVNDGFKVRVQYYINSFSVDAVVTPVPELLTTSLLIGAAALGVVLLRRKRGLWKRENQDY